MSFEALKKNRENSLAKLVAASDSLNTKKSYGDDTEWKPTADKAGNGYVVLRFLPEKGDDIAPHVTYYSHFFKGQTGRWYVENSRTTFGEPDPVSEMNSRLWNAGPESDKELARSMKRKKQHVANVYIINDTGNPDNNGKVFKYKFGAKIMAKIDDALKPQFEDEQAFDPFNFWSGADFKLKFRNVDGQRNYDLSSFDTPSEFLGGDDGALEEVYNQLHDLSVYIEPKNYKSYDELKRKLVEVVGPELALGESMAGVQSITEPAPVYEKPKVAEAPPVSESAPTPEPAPSAPAADDDDDDSLSYFAKLAQS